MTTCTRFEDEGLIALEQGQALREHFNTCEVCIEEQRKYKSLKKRLHSSTRLSSPVPSWQKNVLDQIRVQEKSIKVSSNKRWYGSLAAGIATIGIGSILFLQTPDAPVSIHGLQQQLVSSDRTYRGEDAKVGDRLNIMGSQDSFKYTQIRVYRNGRPYFSCGLEKACDYDEQSNAFNAHIELSAIGEYQTVLIRGNQALSVSNINLDLDVLDAQKLEAQFMLGQPVNVE